MPSRAAPEPMPAIRCEAWFAGRVQGVGFRYTTQRFAAQRPIAGYVRNDPDGRVELVVEGERSEVDALLDDLRRHFGSDIADEQSTVSPATGQFTSFTIRA